MKPRHRIGLRKLMVAVGLIAVGLGVVRWLVYSPSIRDRIIARAFGHDTEYATRYTEASWNRVTPGMTPSQVEALLGPPLEALTYAPDFHAWRYSRSPGDTHYWLRVVYFQSGQVSRLNDRFRVD